MDLFTEKQKYKVFWEERSRSDGCPIEFDGSPFISNGKLMMDCHHSPDRKKSDKEQKRLKVTVAGNKPQQLKRTSRYYKLFNV